MITVVSRTNCPKSVRNRCVIETFNGVFVLLFYFLVVGLVFLCRVCVT